jgi:hypothetical protein
MTGEKLELILAQHDIHPAFWPEMKVFVFDRKRPRRELFTLIRFDPKYKDALDAILVELSKQVKHKFPPKVRHYESLKVPA